MKAEEDLRIHQPYSRVKVNFGKGRMLRRLVLRFPLYANFSLSEIDGGITDGMEKEERMGTRGFLSKAPFTENGFNKQLERYEELDIMKDRFEQMLEPLFSLSKKLVDLGHLPPEYPLHSLLNSLSKNPIEANNELDRMMLSLGVTVEAEDGSVQPASTHDFLSEHPIAHTIIPIGPSRTWLLEENRLRNLISSTTDNNERLRAQEVYSAHMDMIPDSPLNADEETLREYRRTVAELMQSGLMERKDGGMAYSKLIPSLSPVTYGRNLLKEYKWGFDDEMSPTAVLQKKEDEKGDLSAAHHKFYLLSKPFNLNEEHPSLGPYLAYAFLYGGGRQFSVPDRTVLQDDGTQQAQDFPYNPHETSEMSQFLKVLNAQSDTMWQHMALWEPNKLLRLMRRGVTGHNNTEISRLCEMILDAHPFFDLNGTSTSDSGYYTQTPISSDADMDIIRYSHKREKENLEDARERIDKAKETLRSLELEKRSVEAEDYEKWQDDFQLADQELQNAILDMRDASNLTDRLGAAIGNNLPIEVTIPSYFPHTPGMVTEIDPAVGFTGEEVTTPPWEPGVYLLGEDSDDDSIFDLVRAHHLESLHDRLDELKRSGILELGDDEQSEAWVQLHMSNGLKEEEARRFVAEDTAALMHYARMFGPTTGKSIADLTGDLTHERECPACDKGVVVNTTDHTRPLHVDCEKCNGTGINWEQFPGPHWTAEEFDDFPRFGTRRVGYVPEDDCECQFCVNERENGPVMGVWKTVGRSGMPLFQTVREDGEPIDEEQTDEEHLVWNPVDAILSHRLPDAPLFIDNSRHAITHRERMKAAMLSDEGPLAALAVSPIEQPCAGETEDKHMRMLIDRLLGSGGEEGAASYAESPERPFPEPEVEGKRVPSAIDRYREGGDRTRFAPETDRPNLAMTDYYGNPLPGHPDYETHQEKERKRLRLKPDETIAAPEDTKPMLGPFLADKPEPEPEDDEDGQVQASSDPIEIAWDALLKNIGLL